MSNSIAGQTRAYLDGVEGEVTIDEIVDFLIPTLRTEWTADENLRYRIKNIVRQSLNHDDWYSLARNTYIYFNTASEKERALILENQREQIVPKLRAYAKRAEIKGQLTLIYKNGEVEIVEGIA